MKKQSNSDNHSPYAISFGRIPGKYIDRDLLTDDIVDVLNDDPVTEQAFKITGVRGAGKTVTLTAIEKRIKNDKRWIVIDLKSTSSITEDLIANLYSEVPFLKSFIDASINLSALGIGINLGKKSPVSSLDAALKKIVKEIKKKGKKLLIVIDEIRKTNAVIDFIQEFQILIREDLPVFLLAAGLYEDIEDVENTDGLTFFLRAETIRIAPLSLAIIKADYKETLELDEKTALELAQLTMGYAFAYQAFGKYMWESGEHRITEMVLAKTDNALSVKVYEKIWSELSPQDKLFLKCIAENGTISTEDLLLQTNMTHSKWSTPRKRLIGKGIIDGSVRGQVSMCLPRFKEFIESQEIC